MASEFRSCELTSRHEENRAAPWAVEDAPEAFIASQLKGIVGVEIPISRIEGKWKASQNRPGNGSAGRQRRPQRLRPTTPRGIWRTLSMPEAPGLVPAVSRIFPFARRSRYTIAMTDGLILHPDNKTRCWWPGTDPFYVAYHDTEWGVPEFDDRALFEKLILDGFQAGLVVDHHPAQAREFPEAFAGFDPAVIARFDDAQVEALMLDSGIVRNRAEDQAPSRAPVPGWPFRSAAASRNYLWDLVDGRPVQNNVKTPPRHAARNRRLAQISKALKAEGFNFVGPTIVYAFMQAVGMVNDHLTGCFRHAECAAHRREALMAKEPRVWQRMLSGRRLDLLDPSPLDVELDDIAHGLARVARWNGQTVGSHIFSVAQHSLLVEAIAHHMDPAMSREWRLAVLLHDAPNM